MAVRGGYQTRDPNTPTGLCPGAKELPTLTLTVFAIRLADNTTRGDIRTCIHTEWERTLARILYIHTVHSYYGGNILGTWHTIPNNVQTSPPGGGGQLTACEANSLYSPEYVGCRCVCCTTYLHPTEHYFPIATTSSSTTNTKSSCHRESYLRFVDA